MEGTDTSGLESCYGLPAASASKTYSSTVGCINVRVWVRIVACTAQTRAKQSLPRRHGVVYSVGETTEEITGYRCLVDEVRYTLSQLDVSCVVAVCVIHSEVGVGMVKVELEHSEL